MLRRFIQVSKAIGVAVLITFGAIAIMAAIPIITALISLLITVLFFGGIGFLAYVGYREYQEEEGE